MTISAGEYTRRIIMTRSGEVKILPGADGGVLRWQHSLSDVRNGTKVYLSSSGKIDSAMTRLESLVGIRRRWVDNWPS